MDDENKCPIWGTHAECTYGEDPMPLVASPRAGGKYSSEINRSYFEQVDDKIKVKLTSWLVEKRRLGVKRPKLYYHLLEEIANRRDLTPQERAERVLVFSATNTTKLGEPFSCSERKLSRERNSFDKNPNFEELLAHSESLGFDEIVFLLKYLKECNYIIDLIIADINTAANYPDHQNYFQYVVSMAGYARIAELQSAKTDSSQAFVAMWFDDSMQQIYNEGIAHAIVDAGYDPMRIDRKDHNNKIDDEIISQIRRSRFVVADFTHGEGGARGGVYFEAGFALGLNIPVIYMCKEDQIGNVHFDTRQYNHILWKNADELRVMLSNRISATIGDGPRKGKS